MIIAGIPFDSVGISGCRFGLFEGCHVFVYDEHLCDVDAFVVHGMIVCFVEFDGTG